MDNLRSLSKNGTTNAVPSVNLTSPTAGASFTAPAIISLAANASDSDGTISKVEFYQGTTLLSTATASPYTYSWTNVAAGSYSLTAKATDNAGAVTTSSAVNVTVAAAPTGQAIPGKIEAESFTIQSGIQTEATTDTGGGLNVGWIDAGDWLDYAVSVASAGTYTVSFRVASAVGGGQLQLRNSAGTTLGSVNVANTGGWQTWTTLTTSVTLPAGAQTLRVYAPAAGANLNWLSFAAGTTNAAPSVGLTSPTAGASFTAPATISLAANASDSDGTISKVEFYQGSTLLSTDTSSPYSYSWTGVAAGTYSITARATDNAGAVTTSGAVSVTVSGGTGGSYCATTSDFSYGAVSSGGNVTFTFHPLGATAGGNLAILYLRVGSSGTYPGYSMTKNAAGDFTYTLALASGTVTSLYFTYQVGAGGPERNNAATPFTYTVGQSCTAARTALSTTAASTNAQLAFPNPVDEQLTVTLPAAGPATITLTDALGRTVLEQATQQPCTTLDVRALRRGVYQLTVRSAAGLQMQRVVKQ